MAEDANKAWSPLFDRILGEKIDPERQRVVKFFPGQPPRSGTKLLVDDVPYEVTRCTVTWDGPRWRIRSMRARRTTT